MKPLFREYLERLGVANSRIPSLCKGFNELHKSLAQLDFDNTKIINDVGVVNLLQKFAECEDLRVLEVK